MTPQESIPAFIEKPPGALITMWVIYDHPKDYDGFVLRAQFPIKGDVVPSPLAWYASDPEQLRAILPPGCVNLGRQPDDEPQILECWME